MLERLEAMHASQALHIIGIEDNRWRSAGLKQELKQLAMISRKDQSKAPVRIDLEFKIRSKGRAPINL